LTSSADALSDLAPTGKLRAAINLGNPVLAQSDPGSGRLGGVSVALATELARRLGVEPDFQVFHAAGKVFDALADDVWDVAFLARDPVRAAGIDFTAPYVIIEGTYMVREDSPLSRLEDFDREGVRIAVGKGAAYDLYLTRALKHATLVRAPTSAAAIDAFIEQGLEAAAGVRQPLVRYPREHGGYRVLDSHFTAIEQAMGTPRGREAGLAFLREFVEDVKGSGFVAKALARSGQGDATVAPHAASS